MGMLSTRVGSFSEAMDHYKNGLFYNPTHCQTLHNLGSLLLMLLRFEEAQYYFDTAFSKVDVIMTPTTRGPAFEMGSKGSDPIQMYLEDLFTISANLAGLPAMSLPNGNIENKPIGLQIIGNFLDESSLPAAEL